MMLQQIFDPMNTVIATLNLNGIIYLMHLQLRWAVSVQRLGIYQMMQPSLKHAWHCAKVRGSGQGKPRFINLICRDDVASSGWFEAADLVVAGIEGAISQWRLPMTLKGLWKALNQVMPPLVGNTRIYGLPMSSALSYFSELGFSVYLQPLYQSELFLASSISSMGLTSTACIPLSPSSVRY